MVGVGSRAPLTFLPTCVFASPYHFTTVSKSFPFVPDPEERKEGEKEKERKKKKMEINS